MIIPTNKLDFFKELYEEALEQTSEIYANLEKWLKQYKGSKEIDGGSECSQVRNITYELIESQNTTYIPNPVVTPRMYSEKNERNAKSVETLLRNIRNALPFEQMNDIDERYNPIYGGSIWLVEWDNSIVTHNTVGEVRASCLSPLRFVGQPNIYSIEDMEYCFVKFETTKEDIMRRYDVGEDTAFAAENENDPDEKTATLFVCYYKDENDKVCEYVWSGDVELLDIDDYYSRKKQVCKACGKQKKLCTCEKPKFELQSEEYEELTRDIRLSDGTVIPVTSEVIKDGQFVMEYQKQQVRDESGAVSYEENGVFYPLMEEIPVIKREPTKLPFYTPKRLPIVIRKNTSTEDSLLGQSDCEFIRPQQQAINKIETRIMEKLMGAGVYPIVPDKVTVELDNSIFKKVFRASPDNFNHFGRVDLQVDISRDLAQSERLYDQAKRILGISDSFQGQYDSSAQSGVAKQLQIQQSSGRLDSKRQMKNAAYSEIDRIIFEYYLAYADEPRPATYKDAEGRMQNITFNRYDFIERDEAGEYYYNDEYLFSADATIDLEQSRATLWQENRQNYQAGAYGDPALPQTQLIFWLNMDKAHYPFARDNVERIREEIARQQEMAMMQQQIQDLQGEVANRQGYEDYLLGEIKKNGGTVR